MPLPIPRGRREASEELESQGPGERLTERGGEEENKAFRTLSWALDPSSKTKSMSEVTSSDLINEGSGKRGSEAWYRGLVGPELVNTHLLSGSLDLSPRTVTSGSGKQRSPPKG